MKIPKKIQEIGRRLTAADYEAFLVGGCVRDLLLGEKPADWDIATNAKPQAIQKIFPKSFYENKFGTVSVKTKQQGIVEITTYRLEESYSDTRHPDKITFTKKLEDDLARRDFTINALAIDLSKTQQSKPLADQIPKLIIDPFSGRGDLKKQLIRAVGTPQKRFKEDALRLLRAVRFSSQLDFKIEPKTFEAIKKNASLLKNISKERIRDEFTKIILSPKPSQGVSLLKKAKLLPYIIPELEQGIGIGQNYHHIYTVWKHSLLSLKYCPSKKLSVRLAALLHDIAKPQTKRGKGKFSTFYNHDLIGSRLVHRILTRLRFPRKIIDKTALLIRNHMFYYEVDTVTPSSVRKLLRKVGPENIADLIDLRIADRLGSGCPKAKPYKLRHLEYLIDQVSKDPISVKMLKINGNHLYKEAKIERGPQMGIILEILLSEVLKDPKKNTKKYLLVRAKALKEQDLKTLEKKARAKIEEKKIEEDQVLKRKHWVK